MFHLENDTLKITVAAKGAELKNVFHKQHGLEYMWSGNPAYWAKTSPVLFPIVGQLKEDSYRYKNKSYNLPRHGFAREKEFTVIKQDAQSLIFSLQSTEETKAVYPFDFTFAIVYELQNDELLVTYRVENKGTEEMLFSVGGHPAFAVPLVKGTDYEDYSLFFDKEETTGRWPVQKDGRIGKTSDPLLQHTKELPLTKALFEKDAVVLKNLASDAVELRSGKTSHGLRFSFAGFPYLGIWASPGADFVCIEPWCGIADSVEGDGDFEHKEGVNVLLPAETFLATWKVKFY